MTEKRTLDTVMVPCIKGEPYPLIADTAKGQIPYVAINVDKIPDRLRKQFTQMLKELRAEER